MVNSQSQIDKFIDSLSSVMENENPISLLKDIKKKIEHFKELNSHQNTLTISSKHTLSAQDQSDIISLVGAEKDVIVECIQDDSVVGGFSAVYKGRIYDGSLYNQIIQLQNKLEH